MVVLAILRHRFKVSDELVLGLKENLWRVFCGLFDPRQAALSIKTLAVLFAMPAAFGV